MDASPAGRRTPPPGPVALPSILDRNNPGQIWQRDHSQPYASADDYAIIGRFHNFITGGVTVVIGGLGRNGTEAGVQYLTDPHYLDELEQHLGHPLTIKTWKR